MDTFQDNINNGKVDKASVLTSQDLNDIVDTTFHYCSGCTNTPSTANGYLLAIKYRDSYCKQMFFTVDGTGAYERVLVNNEWKSWRVIGQETLYSDLSSYFENDWIANGECRACVLPNGTKILTVSVKSGTAARIMTLPAALRPNSLVYGIAGNTGTASGSLTITSAGAVTVGSSLVSAGYACFSIMYQ